MQTLPIFYHPFLMGLIFIITSKIASVAVGFVHWCNDTLVYTAFTQIVLSKRETAKRENMRYASFEIRLKNLAPFYLTVMSLLR